MNCTKLFFNDYVIYPYELRLNQRSRHRYRRRLADFDKQIERGTLLQQEARIRLQCNLAFLQKANCTDFLHSLSR